MAINILFFFKKACQRGFFALDLLIILLIATLASTYINSWLVQVTTACTMAKNRLELLMAVTCCAQEVQAGLQEREIRRYTRDAIALKVKKKPIVVPELAVLGSLQQPVPYFTLLEIKPDHKDKTSHENTHFFVGIFHE